MNRKLVILVFVFVAVAAALLIRKTISKTPDLTTYEDLAVFFPAGSSEADVREIVLRVGDNANATARIVRQGEEWILPEMYDALADEHQVRELIRMARELRGEFRAEDKALLADFGLVEGPESKGFRMIGTSGQTLLDIQVGKGDGRSAFVRRPGEDRVYVVQGNILFQTGLNRDSLDRSRWMNRNLTVLPQDSAQEIILVGPDGTVTLTAFTPEQAEGANATVPMLDGKNWRADLDTWTEEQSMTAAKFIESALALMHVDEAVDPARKAELGLEEPEYLVRVRTWDRTVEIAGTKSGEEFFVEILGKPRVYRVSGSVFGRVFPDKDSCGH
ncbi:MAG: DUF4340 domain-containing protein [Deltaproteobacteria bacterium]|nr:DUF4340 domain-containing protein [Deltaproteobacteria bacterium]